MIPPLNETKLFEAPPIDTSLILFRRFGHINNLGVSGSQFNIYKHPNGGYILRVQDEAGEKEYLAHIPAGYLPTFSEVYERIMGYFSDMLIPSAMMKLPYNLEVVFDTTPGEARRYICILASNEGGVEETREQHGTDLLAKNP